MLDPGSSVMQPWCSIPEVYITVFLTPGLPHRNHKNRMDFQVGDKICCTRNNYVTDRSQELGRTRAAPMTEQQAAVAVPTQQGGPLTSDPQEGSSYGRAERKEKKKKKEEKEPERERLCNGEIFYITEVGERVAFGAWV